MNPLRVFLDKNGTTSCLIDGNLALEKDSFEIHSAFQRKQRPLEEKIVTKVVAYEQLYEGELKSLEVKEMFATKGEINFVFPVYAFAAKIADGADGDNQFDVSHCDPRNKKKHAKTLKDVSHLYFILFPKMEANCLTVLNLRESKTILSDHVALKAIDNIFKACKMMEENKKRLVDFNVNNLFINIETGDIHMIDLTFVDWDTHNTTIFGTMYTLILYIADRLSINTLHKKLKTKMSFVSFQQLHTFYRNCLETPRSPQKRFRFSSSSSSDKPLKLKF